MSIFSGLDLLDMKDKNQLDTLLSTEDLKEGDLLTCEYELPYSNNLIKGCYYRVVSILDQYTVMIEGLDNLVFIFRFKRKYSSIDQSNQPISKCICPIS